MSFVNNPKIVKEAIVAIREGLQVCIDLGINPKLEKANKLYYLPMFISVPIARKVYSNEALSLMFDGHAKHSPDEMKKMLEDIVRYGEKQNTPTPNLIKLEREIIELSNTLL